MASGWYASAACAMIAALAAAPAAQSAEPAGLAIVLDASGSMWGNLPGVRPPKHELAREALRQALSKHAGSLSVGLGQFGGQGRDCAGAELQVPLAPYSEAQVITPLLKLNPRGRGPLVLGLENAAKALASYKGRRSILVVHDGADNCSRDACEAIEAIATADPDLVVHTVGIAVKPDERDSLACVTTRTRGRRLMVETAEDLNLAIAETVALAAGPAPAPRPVAARPAQRPAQGLPDEAQNAAPGAALTAGVTAIAGATGVRLAALATSPGPALASGLAWTARRLDGPEAGTVAARATAAEPVFALAPGRYGFEVRAGLVSRMVETTIAEGQQSRIVVDLAAGLLQVSVGLGLTIEPPLADALITLRTADQAERGAAVYTGPPPSAPLALEPGRYDLEMAAGLITHRQTVEIMRGKAARVAIALAGAELVIGLATGGTPLAQPPVLSVLRDDATPGGPPVEIARSAAPQARYLLPVGSYTIVARAGPIAVSQLVSPTPGERVSRTLDLNPGRIAARVLLGGRPLDDAHQVVLSVTPRQAASGEPGRRLEAYSAADTFRVGAGGYVVAAQIPGRTLAASAETVVGPGQTRAVDLDLAAGEIRVRPPSASPGARDTVTFVEIRDEAGSLVWHAIGRAPPIALVAPGAYTVRASAGPLTREARLSVAVGERLAVDLSQ